MNIIEYARLDSTQQETLVLQFGTLIDSYEDSGYLLKIYYLNGFFVELTLKNGIILEALPFKRGYRLPEKMAA